VPVTNKGYGIQEREPKREPDGESTTEAFISEFNQCSGYLLCIKLPIISPSPSEEEAYTLSDCSASHKIVNPEFVDCVRDGEMQIKFRRHSEMLFTMAGHTERLPLKEV
jgi:hypothetical protein